MKMIVMFRKNKTKKLQQFKRAELRNLAKSAIGYCACEFFSSYLSKL